MEHPTPDKADTMTRRRVGRPANDNKAVCIRLSPAAIALLDELRRQHSRSHAVESLILEKAVELRNRKALP